MANEKTIKTRIQLKSDIEANWNKIDYYFVPLKGEIIIYSAETRNDELPAGRTEPYTYSRIKIGDGKTSITALPFIDSGTINGKILEEEIIVKPNRQAFPSIGEKNKLYIDLSKKAIWIYTSGGSFIQLSHFEQEVTKKQILAITRIDPGEMTTISVNSNSLIINNGTTPTFDSEYVNVVTDIKEVNNNV